MSEDRVKLREYHAPVWDEPVIMELGHPGRRGQVFRKAGKVSGLIPKGLARTEPPALPEMTEPEVQRHYLHLCQQTLGMVNISLFGTCTMKYNARASEAVMQLPQVADVHPLQPDDSIQGILQAIHEFDLGLRALSGMDQFIFQAGGGADAAYTNCVVTRAYHQSRGELVRRNEIITSIQAHPCNAATAAAAGFKVVTLNLEKNGYPSVDALKAAISDRTAALFINNPDDMGIYNPDIKEWVRLVQEAGGLCFYDHANFNGVMGKIRARELGFDACMFMLHKTFGAPKGGGGPAVGAYGCSAKLAPFLPKPVVMKDGKRYRLDYDRKQSAGKIREFFGNVPQVLKAYAWLLAMGRDGINEASDISVLANNYMDAKLAKIRGLSRSNPQIRKHRMEMTRWSLGKLKQDTGCGTVEVANRMADYGIDPYWMSHEPWVVPEPFTPEAGEMYSKEDLDTWIAVIAKISDEAYSNPEVVKSAPHNQAIAQIKTDWLNDPDKWAITWRAYLRKHRGVGAKARKDPRAAE
jgi:glycine dehydrogenase subunit 2